MKQYYLKLDAYITVDADSIEDAVEQAESIGQDMNREIKGLDIIDVSDYWSEEAYREKDML